MCYFVLNITYCTECMQILGQKPTLEGKFCNVDNPYLASPPDMKHSELPPSYCSIICIDCRGEKRDNVEKERD
jgi:hypothetical protein